MIMNAGQLVFKESLEKDKLDLCGRGLAGGNAAGFFGPVNCLSVGH